MPGLDGKTFTLHEVAGIKTVVLNFWAAWCTTCKEEIPQLAEFQAKGKADVAFWGLMPEIRLPRRRNFKPATAILFRSCSIRTSPWPNATG
ncbi:MAG: TlpA family protein disulfide reductase [Candidatus Firestonebacteria bacterium]|nr:TlpA family protein disulfide reductase [Candidatus Firestonebacteria bacterium]